MRRGEGGGASFIEVGPESHFPIQNLPYGVFSTADEPRRRVGVAIGAWIVDLAALEAAGIVTAAPAGQRVFDRPNVNAFLALGRPAWTSVRARLTTLLSAADPELRDNAALRARSLIPTSRAALHLPVESCGYTDFYSSREHAANVGAMFRDPANALPPNWLEMPIGYNGRASSIIVSGTPVRRPNGQTKAPGDPRPHFGPSHRLDFELETAFVVGTGNPLGAPIPIAAAEQHIFGLVLLNDWSARDIQQWEYVPLGPFNSKTFASSISPWIVTLEALAPFRVAGPTQAPAPLSYLAQRGDRAFDIQLEALLRPRGSSRSTTISRTNFKFLYWSMAQQLAHHTAAGCNAQPGDLMGSGTISGPTPDSLGSLLEITRNGERPLRLDDGTTRGFLEDGDEVTITGWCQGAGYRVGFGDVTGHVLPALDDYSGTPETARAG